MRRSSRPRRPAEKGIPETLTGQVRQPNAPVDARPAPNSGDDERVRTITERVTEQVQRGLADQMSQILARLPVYSPVKLFRVQLEEAKSGPSQTLTPPRKNAGVQPRSPCQTTKLIASQKAKAMMTMAFKICYPGHCAICSKKKSRGPTYSRLSSSFHLANMSSEQSWWDWGKDWVTYLAKNLAPLAAAAVSGVSSLLRQAKARSKEENDNTDYSEVDLKLEQFVEDYKDFNECEQDLERMFKLHKTSERHIEAAKVALTSLTVRSKGVGLKDRRHILSILENQTREMESKMSDGLKKSLRQMSQRIDSETRETTKEIAKIQELDTKPAQFVRGYKNILTTLNRVEESHQEAHKWLEQFPIDIGMSAMQGLESAERKIKQARASANGLKDATFDKVMNRVTKCLENVEKYASKVEKMEPNSRKSQSESACQKLNDALKGVEKCYQEAKDAFGGSEKDPELKSKEEEIKEATERAEQVESLSKQVISCVEETAEITKHLEDAEKSARAAQHMAPKMRKTREFADECGNMSDAIKAAKASYQKAHDNLEELPSDVMGRGSMERKLKSKKEKIEKAQKQQGYLESLRNQPVSCVCVVM